MHMFSPRIGVPILLSLATSFLSLKASAQKQEFEMFLTGKKIGTLVTEKKVKGDVEVYTLTSTADAQILWKQIATETHYSVVFKGGQLTESYFEHKENGEVEKYCKVTPNGTTGYFIHHWKEGKFNTNPVADLCLISSIYYSEPTDGLKMFNEGWGVYTTVKKTAPGEYEFKAPDGSRNVYRYRNGHISDAEFHTSIVTIKVRPKA